MHSALEWKDGQPVRSSRYLGLGLLPPLAGLRHPTQGPRLTREKCAMKRHCLEHG